MQRLLISFVTVALVSILVGCGASAERVSDREQRELPTFAYFLIQDLCFQGDSGSDTSFARKANARARREFVALERSLKAHPDARVLVKFKPADSPGLETEELSVRQLAKTHLDGAEDGGLPWEKRCYEAALARLRAALEEAG